MTPTSSTDPPGWTLCVTLVLSIINPFVELQLPLGTVTPPSRGHAFLPRIMGCIQGYK